LRASVAACAPRDVPNSMAVPRDGLWLAPNIPRKTDGPRTVRGQHLLGVSRSPSITFIVTDCCKTGCGTAVRRVCISHIFGGRGRRAAG